MPFYMSYLLDVQLSEGGENFEKEAVWSILEIQADTWTELWNQLSLLP